MSGEHTPAELTAEIADELQGPSTFTSRGTLLHRAAAALTETAAERDRLKEMFEEWTGYTYGSALDQLRHHAETAEADRDRLRAEVEQLKADRDALFAAGVKIQDKMYEYREKTESLRAEKAELVAALDRYRYVWHWWASDSYDRGGEFNSRMNWARGEDVTQDLTDDQFARIGQQFLERTGRGNA